jgi:hypothetical protein
MPVLRARAYSSCYRKGKTANDAKHKKNEDSGNISQGEIKPMSNSTEERCWGN